MQYTRLTRFVTGLPDGIQFRQDSSIQTLGNMLRASGVSGPEDLDPHFGWSGKLAAIRAAMRATVHTTTRATPCQLVFGRDAMLNVSFEADWQYIKDRKQKLIVQNNQRENRTRIPHQYQIGDRVMVEQYNHRKCGKPRFKGLYTVAQVNDNGTVRLTQAGQAGAVSQTWNIRNLTPCED